MISFCLKWLTLGNGSRGKSNWIPVPETLKSKSPYLDIESYESRGQIGYRGHFGGPDIDVNKNTLC